MKAEDRFADPGIGLSALATNFIVHCPKCEHKAHVLPHHDSWRLTCGNCFHTEMAGHWYGSMTVYVSVKCRECHQPMSRHAEVNGQWSKMKMKCAECGDVAEYEAKLSRHYMNHGLMCDSIFGLPLWLQKEIVQELFWAFNDEHLNLLEQYVRAKLRERGIDNKGSKNSLMFSRLPTFITKARNRVEILKLIDELRKK